MHTLTDTSVQLMEYLLLVNPDNDTTQKLVKEKELFYDIYKTQSAVKTKPHITVANFIATENMEETLMRWMYRVISTHSKFQTTLNNFSGFPNVGTIYARVQNHEPLKKITAELKIINEYLEAYKLPLGMFITHPHITIAKELSPDIFNNALKEYAQKDFHASFTTTELILLKRSSEFDSCKRVTVFKLKE